MCFFYFFPGADERMSKRQKIVKEIFESEQTYISQIHTIVKVRENSYHYN